jgi:type IV pilus assembly protein PilB
MDAEKILNLLVKMGYLSQAQAKQVLGEKNKDEDIFDTIIRLGVLDENKIMEFLKGLIPSRVWTEEIGDVELPASLIKRLPQEFLRKNKIAPIKYEDGKLYVLMFNPLNQGLINELKFYTELNHIIPYAAPLSTVEKLLDKLFPQLAGVIEDIDVPDEVELEEETAEIPVDILMKSSEEGPIVRLANGLIFEAVRMEASDIHIEPQEKKVVVRYRVDGVLRIFHEFPVQIKDSIVARYKIMANLDISEKRRPQDGRIRIKFSNKKIDLRVSTVPTVYGEKVVMRIQEAEKYLNVKLEDLGFEEDDLRTFRRAIWKPWGMILVTGPTGSGKTTTLYSSLMERNEEPRRR